MHACMNACMYVWMYACMPIVFLVLRTKKLFVLLFTLVHIAILVYLNWDLPIDMFLVHIYISTVATNTYIDMDIHLYFNMTTNVRLQGLILSTRAEIWICIYTYIYIYYIPKQWWNTWMNLELELLLVARKIRVPVPHSTRPQGRTKRINLVFGILSEQLHFLLPLTACSHSIDSFHPPFQEHCYPGAPRLEKQHPVCFQKIGGHINFKRQPWVLGDVKCTCSSHEKDIYIYMSLVGAQVPCAKT